MTERFGWLTLIALACAGLAAIAVACSPAAAPPAQDSEKETTGLETSAQEGKEPPAAEEVKDADTSAEPEAPPSTEPTPTPQLSNALTPPETRASRDIRSKFPANYEPSSQPPLGDCFDGVLYQEPLHCYVIEQAQTEGLIQVEAIHDAYGNLQVYLTQTESLSKQTSQFLRDRVEEFLDSWLWFAPKGTDYDFCMIRYEYRRCVLDIATDDALNLARFTLPWGNEIGTVTLHVGSDRALASFRKLWPLPSGDVTAGPDLDSAVSRSVNTYERTGTFDVSDVDTTSFPEPDCGFVGLHGPTCDAWKRHPDYRIAFEWNTGLFVKASPDDTARLQWIEDELESRYHGADFNIIPMKYDFEEMWRWTQILRRFVGSAANTIGVAGAYYGMSGDGSDPRDIFPLPEVRPSRTEAGRLPTIVVGAYDPQAVAEALPTLLPLLGIPVDAVGQINHVDPPGTVIYPPVPE